MQLLKQLLPLSDDAHELDAWAHALPTESLQSLESEAFADPYSFVLKRQRLAGLILSRFFRRVAEKRGAQ